MKPTIPRLKELVQVKYILALLLALGVTASANAQGYDSECRLLPLPGYIMAPQPPNAACLERQRAAAQVAAAEEQRRQAAAQMEEQRRQAAAQAAEKLRQERMAIEAGKCSQATSEDVRSALNNSPTLGRYLKILDVTEPHFSGGQCRSEAMTSRGLYNALVSFEDFNGKTYVRVRMYPSS